MLLNEIISKEQFEKNTPYRDAVLGTYSAKEHIKNLPAVRDIMKKISPDGKFHRTLVFDYHSLKSELIERVAGKNKIMRFLRDNGYTVSQDQFQLGIVTKNDRQVTLKSIFSNFEGQLKHSQKNIVDRIDSHESGSKILPDDVVESLRKRLKILSYYQREIRPFVTNERDDKGLKIIISVIPRIIASQSTEVAWKSCQNLNDGSYRGYVGSGISGGVIIAFIVKKDDLEMNEPLGRVLIKPMKNSETDEVFWYVDRAYGEEKHFTNTVTALFDRHNVHLSKGRYELDRKFYNDGRREVEVDEYYKHRRINEEFVEMCSEGNLPVVKEMMKDRRINPTYDNNEALYAAVSNNHLPVVKLLCKNKDIVDEINKSGQSHSYRIFASAVKHAKFKTFKFLTDTFSHVFDKISNELLRTALISEDYVDGATLMYMVNNGSYYNTVISDSFFGNNYRIFEFFIEKHPEDINEDNALYFIEHSIWDNKNDFARLILQKYGTMLDKDSMVMLLEDAIHYERLTIANYILKVKGVIKYINKNGRDEIWRNYHNLKNKKRRER